MLMMNMSLFSPSAFSDSKIAVSENSSRHAYKLSVWYPGPNQIKQMEELDKRNREELIKEKNDTQN